MPKGIPNKLLELQKSVQDLSGRVTKLEQSLSQPQETPKPQIVEQSITFPIPKDYRVMVDTVLNQEFGLKVDPMGDRPAAAVTIVVPEKYTPLSPEEKQMFKVDLRTKVVDYAEGANGVKGWAEKVFGSFSPEKKAQIVSDRTT